MTVENARYDYHWVSGYIEDMTDPTYWDHDYRGCVCRTCTMVYLRTDAASIAYDLAVAERHAGRTPTWVIPTWMVTAEDVAW